MDILIILSKRYRFDHDPKQGRGSKDARRRSTAPRLLGARVLPLVPEFPGSGDIAGYDTPETTTRTTLKVTKILLSTCGWRTIPKQVLRQAHDRNAPPAASVDRLFFVPYFEERKVRSVETSNVERGRAH